MIDACAGIVVGQVRVASAKINHLTLLPDGSVVVLDKAGDHRGVTVDFHIDALTGEFTPHPSIPIRGNRPVLTLIASQKSRCRIPGRNPGRCALTA